MIILQQLRPLHGDAQTGGIIHEKYVELSCVHWVHELWTKLIPLVTVMPTKQPNHQMLFG